MNLLYVWCAYQERLGRGLRWECRLPPRVAKAYRRFMTLIRARSPLRLQTTAEHTVGLALLWQYVGGELNAHGVPVDTALGTHTAVNHDVGEDVDVPAPQKTVLDDVREYEAFCLIVERLPLPVYLAERRAFLLQFAHQDYAKRVFFPKDAQEIMLELRRTNPLEVELFALLERMDYLLYALEQYLKYGQYEVLVHVARRETLAMKRAAKQIPQFRELFWPDNLSLWFDQFLEAYKDVPLEVFPS